MSKVADVLIDVVEKILEKLNIDDVEDSTWNDIQEWIMNQNFKTLDVELLSNEFIKMNVCNHCKNITFGRECSCEGE